MADDGAQGHGASGMRSPMSTICGLLAARARSSPAAIATSEHGGASLTFAQWQERSSAAARALATRGVRPGSRIAVRLRLGGWLEFAIGYIAALRAGATVVHMEGRCDAADVERALDQASPAIVLSACAESPGVPTVSLADLELGRTRPDVDPRPVAHIAELTHRAGFLRAPSLDALTEADLLALAGLPAAPDPAGVAPDAGWPRGSDTFLHAFAPATTPASIALLAALGPDRGPTVAVMPSARLGCLDVEPLRAALGALRPAGIGVTAATARVLLASGALRAGAAPWLRRVIVDAEPGSTILGALTDALPDVRVSPLVEPLAARRSSATAIAARPLGVGSIPSPPAGGVEHLPVLTSQVGMVWHEQLAPGSFNLSPLVRRYRGDLDVGALESALGEIVARHAALRATFRLVDGELVQVVEPVAPLRLPVVDLGGLSDAGAQAQLARLIADARTRPADLAVDPLFAPCLVRLGPRDHVLIIRVHHAVFDDWSVGPFRAELSSLYTAFRADGPSPLAPLGTSFAEVCRRRLRAREGAAGAADHAFWARELEGAPVTLELPIGDPDLPRGTPLPAAAPVRIELPSDVLDAVTALARGQRVTVFMAMFAAFSVVVGRWCATDDLVMSTLVADRDGADDAALIGCFAKKVVVRISLAGDPIFATLLERTRRSILNALSHKTLAFETVVQDHLDPAAAVHGLTARVSVKFQAAVAPTAPLRLPGLEVEGVQAAAPVPAPHFLSRRDGGGQGAATPWGAGLYAGTFLELSLAHTDAAAALVATGVFHGPAVRQLLAEVLEVAAAAARDPGTAISSLGGADAAAAPAVAPPRSAGDQQRVDLRGFAVDPARTAAALRDCPGVADVTAVVSEHGIAGRRLVARVVPDASGPPTLDELRAHLWRRLPGDAWPAELVLVGAARREEADAPSPERAALSALWAEAGGGERALESGNYWQVFSFVDAMADARRSGVALDPRMVMRNRTVHALAADLRAADVGDSGAGDRD